MGRAKSGRTPCSGIDNLKWNSARRSSDTDIQYNALDEKKKSKARQITQTHKLTRISCLPLHNAIFFSTSHSAQDEERCSKSTFLICTIQYLVVGDGGRDGVGGFIPRRPSLKQPLACDKTHRSDSNHLQQGSD